MSSGGGGKGGGKKTTTETTVPEFIRAPADRNLQRAEALQQVAYMPYYGGEVAAFNPNQEMAMQNNANTAAAFGLLAPTDAMAGMPTPTTFANGMKGYNSMPLYDQAMTDLKTNYGDTVDAYDALFGNEVPANTPPPSLNRGGGGGVSFNFNGGQQPQAMLPSDYNNAKFGANRTVTGGARGGGGSGLNRGSGKLAGSQNKNYIANVRRQTVNNRAKAAGTFGRKYSGDY